MNVMRIRTVVVHNKYSINQCNGVFKGNHASIKVRDVVSLGMLNGVDDRGVLFREA